MISKIIISKSIDDAIVKCGQRLTLNSKVTSVLDKFAKETINRKTEKGLLINDNGEIIHSKNGSKHKVEIWKGIDYRGLYEEHGALHVEHNHPSITKDFDYTECLSDDDMLNVISKVKQADGRGGLWEEYLVKSITAEGTNGSRMTLVRGDNYSDDDEKLFQEARRELTESYDDYVHNKYSNKYNTIRDELINESREKYGNDETLRRLDELDKEASKRAIKELGIFEKSDNFKKIQKKFRDANCKLIVESGNYV